MDCFRESMTQYKSIRSPRLHLGSSEPSQKRRLALAITDQVLWSASFFVFNAVLGFSSSSEYFANVAVGTSIALIALAIARAWTVDSTLLLLPSIKRTPRTASRAYLFFGLFAAGVYCLWALVFVDSFRTEVAILCLAIVYGDSLRYVLLTQGRPDRTIALSVVYLVVGVVSAGVYAGFSEVPPSATVAAWALCLMGFGLASNLSTPELGESKKMLRGSTRPRIAIASEAAYVMGASQAGLLAVSVLQDSDAVAGLRIAYAVALAPASLVVQGLGSQIVRATGRLRGSRKGLHLAVAWGGFGAVLYGVNALIITVAHGAGLTGLELAMPFVWPLTIFLMSQNLSNATHAAYRFHVRIRTAQSIRIATLSVDILIQISALSMFGLKGIVYGYALAAMFRLLTWGVISTWLYRRTRAVN